MARIIERICEALSIVCLTLIVAFFSGVLVNVAWDAVGFRAGGTIGWLVFGAFFLTGIASLYGVHSEEM